MSYLDVVELVGVLLVSYGLLRESFGTLAEDRPYGEGRFGDGTFGGRPSKATNVLVTVGRSLKLLPGDGQLTLTDRKRNAALAVAGVLLVVTAMVLGMYCS